MAIAGRIGCSADPLSGREPAHPRSAPSLSATSATSPDELLRREMVQEQAFVDRVYVQLETSTRNAEALAKEGHGRGRLGHEGGLVERDAMVFQAAKRIAVLNAAHEGWCSAAWTSPTLPSLLAISAESDCETTTATRC